MANEHGFSQVWSDAHRERSAYLIALCSGLWSILKRDRLTVSHPDESCSKAFPTQQSTLAKAA